MAFTSGQRKLLVLMQGISMWYTSLPAELGLLPNELRLQEDSSLIFGRDLALSTLKARIGHGAGPGAATGNSLQGHRGLQGLRLDFENLLIFRIP